jgi:outer membrane immunogenic protein
MSGLVPDGNFLTQTQSIDWTGTVRGRAGYAFGPFLPYVTAGLQWDVASAGAACPAGADFGVCSPTGTTPGPWSSTDHQTHTGFVWGGGVEYAINRIWSLKVEALHAEMSTETYIIHGAPTRLKHDITSVLGGVNFKLY